MAKIDGCCTLATKRLNITVRRWQLKAEPEKGSLRTHFPANGFPPLNNNNAKDNGHSLPLTA